MLPLLCCAQTDIKLIEETQSTMSLQVIVYNVKSRQAIVYAEREAMLTVFFRGVPGSTVETPLVGTDEKGLYAENQYYFDNMFNMKNGRFSSFFTNAILSKYKSKVALVDLVVNIKALRLDIESHNIRKRFGF